MGPYGPHLSSLRGLYEQRGVHLSALCTLGGAIQHAPLQPTRAVRTERGGLLCLMHAGWGHEIYLFSNIASFWRLSIEEVFFLKHCILLGIVPGRSVFVFDEVCLLLPALFRVTCARRGSIIRNLKILFDTIPFSFYFMSLYFHVHSISISFHVIFISCSFPFHFVPFHFIFISFDFISFSCRFI